MAWAYEGVECYVSAGHRNNYTALYRAFNGRDHLYTTSRREYDHLGTDYKQEGVACWVARGAAGGRVPLYRLFNKASEHHFYCVSPQERNSWVRQRHYRVEGIAGYVMKSECAGHVPFMRAWNPQIRDHFYTLDYHEIDDNGPKLSEGQLRWLLNRQLGPHLFKYKRFYIVDGTYFCPTRRAAQAIIDASKVAQQRGILEVHDCDDFAHLLKSAFIEDAYDGGFPSVPYAFGVIWGRKPQRHAWNVLVISDGRKQSVQLVEPQRGTIFPPSPKRLHGIYLLIV